MHRFRRAFFFDILLQPVAPFYVTKQHQELKIKLLFRNSNSRSGGRLDRLIRLGSTLALANNRAPHLLIDRVQLHILHEQRQRNQKCRNDNCAHHKLLHGLVDGLVYCVADGAADWVLEIDDGELRIYSAAEILGGFGEELY